VPHERGGNPGVSVNRGPCTPQQELWGSIAGAVGEFAGSFVVVEEGIYFFCTGAADGSGQIEDLKCATGGEE